MPAAHARTREKTTHDFPVVGIGASAGGLRAIQTFFDNVPPDTGMGFVVIVHLDPKHKSHMAQLVQSHTAMPVTQPSRSLKLEPNHVYIIPPDKDLSLNDGHIRAIARKDSRSRAPINLFFRTLAETHRTQAVAIVMSGTGSDGSGGIGVVRELGGITMAQAPDEAEFPELPLSAISTGQVDLVLPIPDLAAETARLSRARQTRLDPEGRLLDDADEAVVARILTHLRIQTGHDFSGYRRATIMRRLERRMHFTQSETLAEYLRKLTVLPVEAPALFNDLLITVTSFFRDPEAFDALKRNVLPRLFAEADPQLGLRVWVAGCATGEEAYSLAMILCEYADVLESPPPIQIFATDVHEKSFAFAREGLYPDSIAADVGPDRLNRFFSHEAGGYRVRKQIREKVLFASHDLLKDPPFSRLDLVSCRNLLIYFGQDAKQRVATVFHFALRPGGALLLGSSEGMEHTSDLFGIVDRKHRIFQSLAAPRTAYFSSVPSGERPRTPKARSSQASAVTSAWALHQQLLEAYASPSLLVNESGIVLHLSSRVGSYLQRQGGEPSHKLIDMLPRTVRPRFRALLARAFAERKLVQSSGLVFEVEGKKQRVDVLIRPLESTGGTQKAALVVFEESPRLPTSPAAKKDDRVRLARRSDGSQLNRELSELKGELKASIEEHEAVLEEARAANEELQSINEEQRATAEELETSREELQSLNEELRTINQEYRNQNEQLSQTNSDLENLIDSTDVGTIFLDAELRVRRYTPAVTSIFNFVAHDEGRLVSDVTHRLRYPELVSDLWQSMRTLTRIERDVMADDGRWFLLRASPYRSTENRIDGVVLTLLDSSDRKQSEIERELLLRDAQTASIAKSNFIGVMSHELRTPLNAIVGYAGIMNAGAVGRISIEQGRHLDRISASAAHLAHLLDDALEAARLESGSTAVRYDNVDLTLIIREVTDAVASLAGKRGLLLNVDVPDGIAIVTDGTKVRQILFNLLANAVRFTDKGAITVSARVDSDSTLAISISDTGIGIAPEHLEKVFERFWQVDQTRTRTRGGTGLGLMVSRGLARQMGGDIQVTSELGRGSKFTFTLPLFTGAPLQVPGAPDPER